MNDTIFNYIDSVLFNKQKTENINEDETAYSLYMLNRWCSMYSSDIAHIINETSNKYSKIFENKQDSYNFSFYFLPKKRKKRINYLKKNKENKKEEENPDIKFISNNLEISEREVNDYIDLLKEFSK